MRILLAWGRDADRALESTFHDWLQQVFPSVEVMPFRSRLLRSGDLWTPEPEPDDLGPTDLALVCLTRVDAAKNWPAFETGYLMGRLGQDRMAAIFFGGRPADVPPPITQLRFFTATRDGLRALGEHMAEQLGLSSHATSDLAAIWWSELAGELSYHESAGYAGGSTSRHRAGKMALLSNASELRDQLRLFGPSSSQALESVVLGILRGSGVEVISRASRPDEGADLAAWIAPLQQTLGNPVLIELKHRIETEEAAHRTATALRRAIERGGGGGGLVIYQEGPSPHRWNEDFAHTRVLFLRVVDLISALEERSLDRVVEDIIGETSRG